MTKSIYRKSGATVRLEWTPQSRAIIETTEAGEAVFDAGTLVATAKAPRTAPVRTAVPELENLARSIAGAIGDGVRLDRLVLATGAATHELGERRWSDSNARCFASVSVPDTPLQLELDLGAATLAGIELSPIARATSSLRGFRGDMAPPRELRLAPMVTASLSRALAGISPSAGARVVQGTHPDFPFDGNGNLVEVTAGPDWPNVYRPSYRAAPVTMPFHLDIEAPSARTSGDSPIAVALLEPFRMSGGELTMIALCTWETGAFRIAISETPEEWLRAVRIAGEERVWFPFGAGSWGRNVALAW